MQNNKDYCLRNGHSYQGRVEKVPFFPEGNRTLNLLIDSWKKQEIHFSPPRKPPIDKIENQESLFSGEMVWRKV